MKYVNEINCQFHYQGPELSLRRRGRQRGVLRLQGERDALLGAAQPADESAASNGHRRPRQNVRRHVKIAPSSKST